MYSILIRSRIALHFRDRCFVGHHLFSVWVAVGLLIFYVFAVPGAIVYITKIHKKDLYTPEYLLMFGFLYNGFEHGREWWEVVVLARKTVIAIVIVYFTDPFIQSFAALFVLTLSLYVQLEFKPYKHVKIFCRGLLSIESAALHSHGLDSHSRVLLC